MSTNKTSSKSSSRSVAAHPTERDDVNTLVEEAAKKFENMDQQLKLLIENLQNQHKSMIELNNCRYKTAKHLESLVTNTPLVPVVSAPFVEKVVKKTKRDESHKSAKEKTAEQAKSKDTDDHDVVSASEETKVTDNRTPPVDSFMAVHQSIYNLSNSYQQQYNADLIQYAVDWERTVAARVQGLLIRYRELHQQALHYQKKVQSLSNKRSKSTRLVQKLDRNEIKQMGANETRDTAGESLWLFIDEVVTRAWRDVLPLLYRACHFEASFSYQQANLFARLNKVGNNLQSIGQDWGCESTGRLADLAKKRTEELYTAENPFIKLTPLKSPKVEETKDLAVVPYATDNTPSEPKDFAPDGTPEPKDDGKTYLENEV